MFRASRLEPGKGLDLAQGTGASTSIPARAGASTPARGLDLEPGKGRRLDLEPRMFHKTAPFFEAFLIARRGIFRCVFCIIAHRTKPP
jgi:hypothetical protein